MPGTYQTEERKGMYRTYIKIKFWSMRKENILLKLWACISTSIVQAMTKQKKWKSTASVRFVVIDRSTSFCAVWNYGSGTHQEPWVRSETKKMCCRGKVIRSCAQHPHRAAAHHARTKSISVRRLYNWIKWSRSSWIRISGSSSFGRASAFQAEGGRFEPGLPLEWKSSLNNDTSRQHGEGAPETRVCSYESKRHSRDQSNRIDSSEYGGRWFNSSPAEEMHRSVL